MQLALKAEGRFDFDRSVLPPELRRLSWIEKRVTLVENSWEVVGEIIEKKAVEEVVIDFSIIMRAYPLYSL